MKQETTPVTKFQSRGSTKRVIYSSLSAETTFTQAVKDTRLIDKTATAQARARDGVCLYGLLHKDGDWGPLDGHHITAVGEGGDDDIENIVSLCRKHHGMAEDRRITQEELYAILALYHGYRYEGIQPWTTRFLNSGGSTWQSKNSKPISK